MTIPFLPAVHFTPGREAKVDSIVVHWMTTTLAGCDATFTSGSRRASAHFGIEGGTIHQYVRESDTAWHAGNWDANVRSIGIEHSAAPGRDATALTIATSVTLIVGLCRKYGIDPSHIYPHKKFVATACPGTLPIAEIIARVRAQLTTKETDMPLTQDDADLVVHTLLVTNLGSSGPNVAVALQHASALTNVNVAALAAAVVAAIPAGGAVTQPMLEAALRTVLGSVDGKV